jgi:hypothetical protein
MLTLRLLADYIIDISADNQSLSEFTLLKS